MTCEEKTHRVLEIFRVLLCLMPDGKTGRWFDPSHYVKHSDEINYPLGELNIAYPTLPNGFGHFLSLL